MLHFNFKKKETDFNIQENILGHNYGYCICGLMSRKAIIIPTILISEIFFYSKLVPKNSFSTICII